MRSMKALEGQFGSLVALNEQLQLLLAGTHLTPHTALTDILPLGLLHEPGAAEELLDLSPSRYEECLRVLVAAINESFPDPGKADQGDQPDEATAGATGTTSPPSASVAATTSSGA